MVMRKILEGRESPFIFLLNADTEIDPDCLNELVETMADDEAVGMAEAKQSPKEHPRWYNPQTLETGWCSGGGVLIDCHALREVGLFDNDFFLYCEDVDLSWRMWLHGWKCKINPQAIYTHFTEDLDTNKDQSVQQYYSLRNGFWMHYKFDSIPGILAYHRLFNRVIPFQPDEKTKERFRRARRDALKGLWKMLLKRLKLLRLPESSWIYFNEFDYEKRRRFIDTKDGKRLILDEQSSQQAA